MLLYAEIVIKVISRRLCRYYINRHLHTAAMFVIVD